MVGRPRPWMKISTLHGLSDGNLLFRLSLCQSRASLPIFERDQKNGLGRRYGTRVLHRAVDGWFADRRLTPLLSGAINVLIRAEELRFQHRVDCVSGIP